MKQISGTQSHSLQSLSALGHASKVWQVPLCTELKDCHCQGPTLSPRFLSADSDVEFDLWES